MGAVRGTRVLLIPCLLMPFWPAGALAQAAEKTTESITPSERFTWFVNGTVGPATLTGGLVSAGFGTLTNRPREYGPHWEGFGDRYGMRLTGVVTSNAMEAGLGALWGEDPRYQRAGKD